MRNPKSQAGHEPAIKQERRNDKKIRPRYKLDSLISDFGLDLRRVLPLAGAPRAKYNLGQLRVEITRRSQDTRPT